jgi:hypothetical protein
MASTNRPTHNVFAVTKTGEGQKADWFELGAAWPHQTIRTARASTLCSRRCRFPAPIS